MKTQIETVIVGSGAASEQLDTALCLLERAANMLQDMQEGDMNNSLAMEIFDFLESLED